MLRQLKSKLMPLLAHWSLGREAALALMLLRLIAEATDARQQSGGKGLAISIYRRLPASWRAPLGPATQDEFVRAVSDGEAFWKSLRALANRG